MHYSEEDKKKTFDAICGMIEDGESLRNSLNIIGLSRTSFFNWIRDDKPMIDQYSRAMKIRADMMFDEMLDIADTPLMGATVEESVDELGIAQTKTKMADMWNHRRLQIDTRKWILGRMNPKKYGEASMIKLADNDGEKLKPNAIFSTDLLKIPIDGDTPEDEKNEKD